jgi:hypothetical protein
METGRRNQGERMLIAIYLSRKHQKAFDSVHAYP